MRLYHRTDSAAAILQAGFRDNAGSYMFVGIELTGVFLSDVPVDGNEGAKGDELLEVEIAEELISDYELVDESGYSTYREWCVPAELLNEEAASRLVSDDEAAAATLARFIRRWDDSGR